MDTLTFGTEIAANIIAMCVWVLIIAVTHELMHRFFSKAVADDNRRVDQLHETIKAQQDQLDDLKR